MRRAADEKPQMTKTADAKRSRGETQQKPKSKGEMKMKKNILTKALGLLLAASLTLGAAGCGQDADQETTESRSGTASSEQPSQSAAATPEPQKAKDPVTLEWYYRGNGIQKDTGAVQDRVNELLKETEGLEHVTVHLNCFIGSDYKNQVLLAQTSGAQMDILSTVTLASWVEEINNGTYRAIDDYLAGDYGTLYEELPEWVWESMRVDGKTYIVPSLQQGASKLYLVIPKEYARYVDVDKLRGLAADGTDIQALCDAWHEAYGAITDNIGKDGKYLLPLSYTYTSNKYMVGGDKDFITGAFGVASGSTEVVNFAMNDDFKALAAKAAEWFAEGLIPEDILLTGEGNYGKGNMLNDSAFVLFLDQSVGDEETASKQIGASYGFDVVALPLNGDAYFMANGWGAGGNGITASCKHPEEAMRFLEVLNTKEGQEIYNTLVYGLEGVHYEKLEGDRIKTLEYDGTQGGNDTTYAGIKWIIGNTTYAYPNQACSDTMVEEINEVNENPDNILSPIMGFRFNEAPVSNELAQCQAVYKEYVDTLRFGVTGKDFESKWDEYVAKMEAAGVSAVIEEMQRQLDQWRQGQ